MRSVLLFLSLFLSAVVLFGQAPNSESLLRLAQSFEQQGDFERALDLYGSLYASDSANYGLFDAVRRMTVQLKRYDEAVALSLRRLRMTPYDAALQANIGGLYYMAGRERQADSVWNLILASSGKNQLVIRTVAGEQIAHRLFDRAVKTYLGGRITLGDRYAFANDLGYLHGVLMDYRSSVREYLLLLRQNEQQYDFVQTRLAAMVSKPDALTAASAVVGEELAGTRTVPLLRLQQWLFLEAKRFADAFGVARSIEQLLTSNGVEMFQFAERLSREKEHRIAAQAYAAALSRTLPVQHVPAARFGYARCIEELGAAGDSAAAVPALPGAAVSETRPVLTAALSLYSALAAEYPYTNTGAGALFRIGMVRYRQMNDLDGALTVFDSVLSVSPAGPMLATVQSVAGEILTAQNRLPEAAARYRIIARSPHADADRRTNALFRLAELEYFRAEFDSALALLRPLTENLRTDETNDALLLQYLITENRLEHPDALQRFARAELLARQNRMSESVRELLEIVELDPAAPLSDNALLTAGERSVRMGRYQDAMAQYRRLLEEYKTSNEREKAWFRIGELYQFHLFDAAKAVEAYGTLLERHPFSLLTEEARKRIRLLRGDAL